MVASCVSRGSEAFAKFLSDNDISDREAGPKLLVSHTAVFWWRTAQRPPEDDNRANIELFCAKVEAGKPVANPEKPGHWISAVPREWWTPEGAPVPTPIQPYAAESVKAVAA